MRIGFVGLRNSVRSIIAESITRKLLKEALLRGEVYSAGIEPAPEVEEKVLQVLEKRGYPTEGLRAKSLEDIPFSSLDILVVVSNEAKERVPFMLEHKRRENWGIELPQSLTESSVNRLVDSIESEVRELLKLT
jgi:arsenate reductase